MITLFRNDYLIPTISLIMLIDQSLYIDPSVANAILVMILGAGAGIGMFIKTRWAKLRYRMQRD